MGLVDLAFAVMSALSPFLVERARWAVEAPPDWATTGITMSVNTNMTVAKVSKASSS